MKSFLMAAIVTGMASTACAGDRPNILWLTVEDMSPWLSCYGDETVATPHIDALAARGMVYTNAFSNAPVCAPARATLITGCYATSIGAMQMRTGNPSRAGLASNPHAYDEIPSYEATPPPDVRCFPELLRGVGYYCTNNSKQDYQFKPPVTVWDASGRKAHWKNRPDPAQPFFAVFNSTRTHESGIFPSAKRSPAVTDPASVTVPPYYPDTPIVRSDLARTYDNIAAMDAWVGARLSELDEAGLTGTTIVFFFSDHGVGLPRGKRCIYDSGTRVPLIVAHPHGAASVSDRLVAFVDFAPTILSMAGEDPPPWMMGHAFGGDHEDPPQSFVFLHADRMDAERDCTRGVTDGRYRYVMNDMVDRPRIYPVAYADSIEMTAEITALGAGGTATAAQWQMVDPTKPPTELYDTTTDPHEVVNRIGDEELSNHQDRLHTALVSWRRSTDDQGVLDENVLVRTRLWPPDGIQPQTQPPVLVTTATGAHLSSATNGASIGWRPCGESTWRVGGGMPAGLGEMDIEAVAHRIGFTPSEIITITVP
jgi:arylsulfatase A-like enzyme